MDNKTMNLLDQYGDAKVGHKSKMDKLRAELELCEQKRLLAIEYQKDLDKETARLMQEYEDIQAGKLKAIETDDVELLEELEEKEVIIESTIVNNVATIKQLVALIDKLQEEQDVLNRKICELSNNYNNTLSNIKTALLEI